MKSIVTIITETTNNALVETAQNSMPYLWQYFLPLAIVAIIIGIIIATSKRKK